LQIKWDYKKKIWWQEVRVLMIDDPKQWKSAET
jgi:hypothetical protein